MEASEDKPRAHELRANSCFVIMPFRAKWSADLLTVLKEGLGFYGWDVFRSDQMWGVLVSDDIQHAIKHSPIIIADITGLNPNVFYEIGYAHAMGRKVILIHRTDILVPFDIKQYRSIRYRLDDRGTKKLITDLRKTIDHWLSPGFVTPNNMRIVEPPENTPTSLRRFLGVWSGYWTSADVNDDGKLSHTLVVYKLLSNQFEVAYYFGNCPEWGIAAGRRLELADIRDDKLVLVMPQNIQIVYTFVGGTLHARRTDDDGKFVAEMKRLNE